MPAEPVTKNFAQLLDAAPLSEGDFLAINQPGVFNPITLQQGVTRKLTVEAFSDYVIRKHLRMFVGFSADFLGKVKPDAYQLAKMRILELVGQILPIAQYQEVVDILWVGAEANNLSTTYFCYKCNIDGSVRDVNGLYFKFPDWRGMFPRVAGPNGTLRTDMNVPNSPPYDGNNTGDFKPDVTKRFNIKFGEQTGNSITNTIDLYNSVQYSNFQSVAYGGGGVYTQIYLRYFGNFGDETAGASLSVVRYLHY